MLLRPLPLLSVGVVELLLREDPLLRLEGEAMDEVGEEEEDDDKDEVKGDDGDGELDRER